MHRSLALLGTSISNVTMEETLVSIRSFVHQGGFHQIATANTDFLVKAVRDAELRQILAECDLVVPDGMPLLWASRFMGYPLRERVTGADLVPRLGELSSKEGYKLFFLGATPESSAAAERKMKAAWPGAQIVGRLAPPVKPLDEMDHAGILRTVNQANPDILLVAFGNPKQEKWIYRHRDQLRAPVCIGVGAAFDFLAGAAPRAPRWMQASGAEWIHRLVNDPRRLANRYLVDAVQFGRLMSQQVWANAQVNKTGVKGKVVRYDIGLNSVVQIHGPLAGDSLEKLEDLASGAFREGRHVIVDLGAVSGIAADGLATLMQLRKQGASEGNRLKIAGITPSLERKLKLAQAHAHFYAAPSVVEALWEAESSEALPAPVADLSGNSSPDFAALTGTVEICEHLLRSLKVAQTDVARLSEANRALTRHIASMPGRGSANSPAARRGETGRLRPSPINAR